MQQPRVEIAETVRGLQEIRRTRRRCLKRIQARGYIVVNPPVTVRLGGEVTKMEAFGRGLPNGVVAQRCPGEEAAHGCVNQQPIGDLVEAVRDA